MQAGVLNRTQDHANAIVVRRCALMHLRERTLQNCRFSDFGLCGVLLMEQGRRSASTMNRR
jgi:hypothetical protein